MNTTEQLIRIKALLNAVKGFEDDDRQYIDDARDAVQKLIEELAAPVQQEPVAWIEHEWSGSGLKHLHFDRREPSVRDEVMNPVWTPLYTSPQPAQQEPVAWLVECGGDSELVRHTDRFPGIFAGNEFNKRPLVFGDIPPPAQRKPLTDDQAMALTRGALNRLDVVRKTEAAHGIKENT